MKTSLFPTIKIILAIGLIIIVTFITFFVVPKKDKITSETDSPKDSVTNYDESKDNAQNSNIISVERKQEIINFLKEAEPAWHEWEYLQYDAWGPQASCALAAADEMCNVGIEGVPVIAELLITESPIFEGGFPRDYLRHGMYLILRIDPNDAHGCTGTHRIDDCTADCIADFYLLSKTECPKIISSGNSVKEKLAKLRRFGVYAIPYVVEQIQNGFDVYASFFTEIGLHLSAREYAHLVIEKHLYSDEVYSDAEYNKGAEDFDYKAWLEENKEDLDNLFKFLDAYCAEYEAEQNKQ